MTPDADLVTLYAIRYCLSRHSYAFGDGLALIEANLDMLHRQGWARSVADDLLMLAHIRGDDLAERDRVRRLHAALAADRSAPSAATVPPGLDAHHTGYPMPNNEKGDEVTDRPIGVTP